MNGSKAPPPAKSDPNSGQQNPTLGKNQSGVDPSQQQGPPGQNGNGDGDNFTEGTPPFPPQGNPQQGRMVPGMMVQAMTQPNTISMGTAKKLSRVYARNYLGPLAGLRYQAILNYNEPLFFRYWIPAMMRDPHLWYGIEMLKGPIVSKSKFTVVSDDAAVQEFAQAQIDRFLTRGLSVALKCLVYGYCGLETIYKFNKNKGYIEFDKFHYIHPNDVRPVIQEGSLVGMKIRRIRDNLEGNKYSSGGRVENLRYSTSPSADSYNTGFDSANGLYLGLPKIYWAVHDKTYHRWYGRSRLEGAFIPWYETWQPQGFRNIRHLWMYKNAFDSGVVKYPDGGSTQDEYGNMIPNVLLAQEMLDRKETGGGFALPNSIAADQGGWDWVPPTGIPVPDGLFDYGDSLRDEKWEGIGVPPEVAKSEDSGSFAGRRVPQQAFYSFLQEISNEQIYDWDEQNLQYLVRLAFGELAEYSITPVPILLTLQQEEMGAVTGHLPGDENDDFYQGDQQGGGDPNAEGGGEFQENQLSNGRLEDRSTNGFNKAEANFSKGKKKKK